MDTPTITITTQSAECKTQTYARKRTQNSAGERRGSGIHKGDYRAAKPEEKGIAMQHKTRGLARRAESIRV